MKYTKIRAFTDTYFLVSGQNLRCTGKCGYDSVHIRENADQRKPYFDIYYSVRTVTIPVIVILTLN